MKAGIFHGIVKHTAAVAAVEKMPDSQFHRFSLALDMPLDIQNGEILAVNGVCVTARQVESGALEILVWEDTWKLTNFSLLSVGDRVNLELPAKEGYEAIGQCNR